LPDQPDIRWRLFAERLRHGARRILGKSAAAVGGLRVFRAAIYVDKILKGAQSVEPPTKVGLVINRKTENPPS
jgi:hypothetical protein